jgi:hypothetical protein
MKKIQHVVKHDNGWAVKGAGNTRATVVSATQQQAIQVAVVIAKKNHSQVVIHWTKWTN